MVWKKFVEECWQNALIGIGKEIRKSCWESVSVLKLIDKPNDCLIIADRRRPREGGKYRGLRHPHEAKLIRELKALFPDLSPDLEKLEERVVNLNTILAGNFYHLEFHGSTSMKVVLPALVPALFYDDLEIQNGNDAAATFVYMAWGRIKGPEAEHAKKNLREYCKRDTLALIRIHEELAKYCEFRVGGQTSLETF